MGFATEQPFEENIRPGFVGDYLSREHVLPGGIKIKASDFTGADAVKVTLTANAAAASTTLAVGALTRPIPAGTLLDFGTTKFARSTALAPKGAATIPVSATPTAMVTGDTAYYLPQGVKKRIYAGTPVGLTNAQLEGSANGGVLWEKATDSHDVVRIICYDVYDADDNNDANVLRKGTLVRVNHMFWSSLSATLKAKIRADYEVTVGAPGQEVPAS